MTVLGHHIRIRLSDDRVIAPSLAERRMVVRAIHRIAEALPILGFGLADTHLHTESLGDAALANEIARRIGSSLRHRLRLPVGFHLLPARPIGDIWHLGHCLRYINTQASHHGVGWERWYEATSLPDLLGLRPRGAFLAVRVREHLPRIRRSELLHWLGVSQIRPAHGTPEEICQAALAASALHSFRGYAPETNALRRAVIAITGGAVGRRELASLLGVSMRHVTRLRSDPPEPELLSAIPLNLGLPRELRAKENPASTTLASRS